MSALDRRIEEGFGRLGAALVRFRWPVLVLAGLVTAGFGWALTKVEINTSNEYFFLPNDEYLSRYEQYKKTFGTDEFVYVVFETERVFEPETLGLIDRFERRARVEIPHVLRSSSILSVESVVNEDDAIVVRPFIGEIPSSTAALELLRKRAFERELYTILFVAKDERHAGVFLETAVREGDGVYRKDITDAARALADDPEFARFAPKVVGPPIMDADVDRVLASESRKFGLMSFGIISLILIFLFRRFIDVLAPAVVVAVTNVWTIGLMGALGYPLTMMSIVLPGVVVVVGIGDSVHIVSEYRKHVVRLRDPNRAIYETCRLTGIPCLFTSLTTMVGFGSLMAMDLRPGREMGMFAAVGVVIAFVLTFLLLPPLLSFSSTRNVERSNAGPSSRTMQRILEGTAKLAIRRADLIIGVSALLLVVGFVGLVRVHVAADFLRVFDETMRLRQDYEYVDRHLGSTASLEVVIDSGAEGGVFEPEFLAKLESFEAWLVSHELVRGTSSLLTVLRELHQLANDGDPAYSTVPKDRQVASQLFLLFEMGGASRIDDLVTPDRRQVHVSARIKSVSSAEFEELTESIDAWAAEQMPRTRVLVTGMAPLFVRMVHAITRSQVSSFAIAFVSVTLMMILLIRSLRVGLLAMIPNILPIVFTMGYMGFAGITLNIATVMIASIAIGIAVDDTIHFVSHFRHHQEDGLSVEEAIVATTTGVGRALLTTSLVLALGFSVFALSSIQHLQNFGSLTAMTVVVALIADFLLLPALLLRVGRWISTVQS